MDARTRSCGLLLVICTVSSAGLTRAGSSELFFDEDFSVDPGWVTDQPANYYWNSAEGVFHAITSNAQPGYTPTRYAYTLVDYDGWSLSLQFDLELASLDADAGVHFGLYDSNLWIGYYSSPGLPDSNFLHVQPARSSNGDDLIMSLRVRGLNGIEHVEQVGSNLYVEGRWYHFVITYDADLDKATLTVTDRISGDFIGSAIVTDIGGLPTDLDYLGFARDPAGNCCPPVGSGCSGHSCSGDATANLDNVVFSKVIPATIPTVSQCGIGVLSVLILAAGAFVIQNGRRVHIRRIGVVRA